MSCSCPRANDGFRILAASTAPSAAPAPTIVWNSSTNRIIFPADFISSIIFLRRSSNSPRYLVPAIMPPISSVTSRLSSSVSGTSPFTMSWASPSTMAVFPTPGSPTRAGLFLLRRLRIWTTRCISFSRPSTGSNLPARASAVKSVLNWSRVWVLLRLLVAGRGCLLAFWLNILIVSLRTCSKVMPKLSRTPAATPPPSCKRPSRRCSVPI